MLSFLAEFTTYLADLGYNCDTVQAMMAERVIAGLKNPDEIGLALKSVYAKTPQEFHSFDHDFQDFYKRKDERIEVAGKKKQREEMSAKKKRIEERRSSLRGKRGELDAKEKAIREKYKKKREELNAQKEKSLKEHLEEFRKKKLLTKTEENFLMKNENYLKNHPLEKVLKGEADITDLLLKELQQKAESALLSGDLDSFEKEDKLFNIASKFLNQEKSIQRKVNTVLKKEFSAQEEQLSRAEEDEIAELWRKLKEAERLLDEEEQRIKKALKKLENEEARLIQKSSSKNHRDIFISGRNAVQSASEGELSKNFELLSNAEAARIQETIHQESLRLKTRLRKISHSTQRKNVDLRRTVRSSIRTGGEITKLLYKKKKPSKADMVLMLDISGSCSKAAKMLIGFAYALKDAFPNGTRVYAFVNRLFDITEIMDADNVFEATQAVFNTIPTRGVYSDYNVPLESFWNTEKNRLGKESFVMIMGDARNNKNPTGEYYIQQIQRKCLHSYFLCTENEIEWGSGDSIADLYAKIMKTIPITNTNELLRFISTVV